MLLTLDKASRHQEPFECLYTHKRVVVKHGQIFDLHLGKFKSAASLLLNHVVDVSFYDLVR